MKTIYKILLAGMVAGGGMTGTAQTVRDISASDHTGTVTNSMVNLTGSKKTSREPAVELGANWWTTGLFVDLMKPEQTLDLFDPLAPSLPPPETVQVAPPVAAAMPDEDLDVREPNFVLLKLNFR
jgi:hypothetical protein